MCWQFLRSILDAAGFDNNMVDIIMFCVTSPTLSILWNGQRLETFQPTRGIRQGDPLAPYLFLLCMDILSQMIKRAVSEKKWKPVKASRGGPEVSHIFFADDLLLFCEASVEQARNMAAVLDNFCRVSGQKVSLAKTVFFASKNTPADLKRAISDSLNIKHTSDLGRYLGVPILHKRVTVATYDFLIENIRNKLTAWKAKQMSQASRCILIQSVLDALPSYMIQTIELPRGVIEKMEKRIRQFFWDEWDGNRKMHSLAWGEICRPKEQGGLGLKDLRKQNMAFLVKLGWQMFTERDKMWVKMLWAKYGSPLASQRKRPMSRTWRSIVVCVEILRKGMMSSNFLHDDTGSNHNFNWMATRNGKFSVKSAYSLQMSEADEEVGSAWGRVWSMNGPLRSNVFLWRLRRGILPTTHFLYCRHISTSPHCQFCGMQWVGELHEIRDCH